jgi:hypothetical protein
MQPKSIDIPNKFPLNTLTVFGNKLAGGSGAWGSYISHHSIITKTLPDKAPLQQTTTTTTINHDMTFPL